MLHLLLDRVDSFSELRFQKSAIGLVISSPRAIFEKSQTKSPDRCGLAFCPQPQIGGDILLDPN